MWQHNRCVGVWGKQDRFGVVQGTHAACTWVMPVMLGFTA